jgi:hypothetical protein
MKPPPTVASVAKELRLSAWLFGIFAVLSAAIATLDFLATRHVEGGWPVAASVALVAWGLAVHFAQQLNKANANERPNL